MAFEIRRDGTQNALILTRVGADAILTYNVTNLSFTYYNDETAHTTIATPLAAGDLDEIRTIGVSFTIDIAASSAGEVTFQTEVRPRNLFNRGRLFS